MGFSGYRTVVGMKDRLRAADGGGSKVYRVKGGMLGSGIMECDEGLSLSPEALILS